MTKARTSAELLSLWCEAGQELLRSSFMLSGPELKAMPRVGPRAMVSDMTGVYFQRDHPQAYGRSLLATVGSGAASQSSPHTGGRTDLVALFDESVNRPELVKVKALSVRGIARRSTFRDDQPNRQAQEDPRCAGCSASWCSAHHRPRRG